MTDRRPAPVAVNASDGPFWTSSNRSELEPRGKTDRVHDDRKDAGQRPQPHGHHEDQCPYQVGDRAGDRDEETAPAFRTTAFGAVLRAARSARGTEKKGSRR